MTYQQAVQSACDAVGSQAALAKAICAAPALIHQWRAGVRPVPVQHCLAIERATNGAVTRRDLRPDDWHLIWPELAEPTPAEPNPPAHPLHLTPLERLREQYGFKRTPVDAGDGGAAFVAYFHQSMAPTDGARHLHDLWAQSKGLAGSPPMSEWTKAAEADFIDWLIETMWNNGEAEKNGGPGKEAAHG